MKSLILLLVISLPALAQMEEETEALRAMKLSCVKSKVGLGCFNYANMLARIDKTDDAEKFFEMGCKLNHEPSCSKEKWDIPERKVVPETVEVPAEANENSSDEPMRPTYLPSRVTVRSGEVSPSHSPEEIPSSESFEPSSQPMKAPASEDIQSNESSGSVEAGEPEAPVDGSEPPSSLSM